MTIDVLQVITSSTRRGAERFATSLEPELGERGLSVRTVALAEGIAPRLDVEALGSSPLGRDTLRRLRSEIASARVVVAHGSSTLPASFLATIGSGVPYVYRNIGDPDYWSRSALKRLRTAIFLSRASHVVALTEHTGRRLTARYKVRPSRLTAIPNAASEDEFKPRTEKDRLAAREVFEIASGDRVVICVGALSPEKHVIGAIRALAGLPARWRLLVAGDGPERAMLEDEAQRVVPGRVRFLGQLPDPAPLMAAADLLVLPSLTEGLPGVLIEAGMIGVPAVASGVGFIDDVVIDGATGYIVPPGDVGALTDAIAKIEPMLDDFGRAMRERVQGNYSLSVVADKWHEVLVEVIAATDSK